MYQSIYVTLLITILLPDFGASDYIASSSTPFTIRPAQNLTQDVEIVQMSPDHPEYNASWEDILTTAKTEETIANVPDIDPSNSHEIVYSQKDMQLSRDLGDPSSAPWVLSHDSYLDAYAMSHGSTSPATQITDAEPTIPYPTYHEPQYAPPKDMHPPSSDRSSYYRAPSSYYGGQMALTSPTQASGGGGGYYSAFGHQSAMYGPPVYGPPAHYEPDYEVHDHHESYGVPYKAPGLFDKLKMKLNWYLLGKILLKLILFKKFVKFVALLCLLFFIPKLKHKKDDDRSRMLMTEDATAALMQVFEGAMDTFGSASGGGDSKSKDTMDEDESHGWGGQDAACRARGMLDDIDQKYSFSRLWNLYDSHSENIDVQRM